MNDLRHCLQDSVRAYDFELEDCGPKTLYKISYGFGSSHSDVEKTGDALFSLN